MDRFELTVIHSCICFVFFCSIPDQVHTASTLDIISVLRQYWKEMLVLNLGPVEVFRQ